MAFAWPGSNVFEASMTPLISRFDEKTSWFFPVQLYFILVWFVVSTVTTFLSLSLSLVTKSKQLERICFKLGIVFAVLDLSHSGVTLILSSQKLCVLQVRPCSFIQHCFSLVRHWSSFPLRYGFLPLAHSVGSTNLLLFSSTLCLWSASFFSSHVTLTLPLFDFVPFWLEFPTLAHYFLSTDSTHQNSD